MTTTTQSLTDAVAILLNEMQGGTLDTFTRHQDLIADLVELGTAAVAEIVAQAMAAPIETIIATPAEEPNIIVLFARLRRVQTAYYDHGFREHYAECIQLEKQIDALLAEMIRPHETRLRIMRETEANPGPRNGVPDPGTPDAKGGA